MAEDADGDYYYDEGTVNEIMDDWGVYEKDGKVNLHYKPTDNLMKFSDLATVFGSTRAAPDTDELPQGEQMLFVSDGTDANTADGDLALARNPDGTIETLVVAAATGFADV